MNSNRSILRQVLRALPLLMKIGAKSEIHDCTINVAQLLANNDILRQKIVDEIEEAKQTRIDAQYYVANEATRTQTRKNAENARKFVLTIEQIIQVKTPNKSTTSEHS